MGAGRLVEEEIVELRVRNDESEALLLLEELHLPGIEILRVLEPNSILDLLFVPLELVDHHDLLALMDPLELRANGVLALIVHEHVPPLAVGGFGHVVSDELYFELKHIVRGSSMDESGWALCKIYKLISDKKPKSAQDPYPSEKALPSAPATYSQTSPAFSEAPPDPFAPSCPAPA